MTSRHRSARSRRLRFAPWLVVALVVGGVSGGTAAAVQWTAGSSRTTEWVDVAPSGVASPSASAASASPSDTATSSPAATGTPTPAESARGDRAARGAERAATTPSPEASPTTAEPPSASTTGDSVVSSGTCGTSYYASGQVTANGESFDPSGMTAAHRTWAFGTRVRVTNPQSGAAVVVRINDRGPFVEGRCLDLARGAFEQIAPLSVGHLEVQYEVLDD
ncbi:MULTISPECIES: septal ring lytic transglycosylase RlpA family protein [unclassified Solwaraspora]|uniref:septal ring lytic transglycosylase RlpA family protein n=1 Tax=unclassified Solwaraspora TaxID=2627926 RepID=UPI00259B29B7|nr:septal ring lytic transglycosylase RlpA family protein [Solwaraspora sp. WMMA2056]WJK41644.1 septal ring lytic transglycosylase RlpA family protein [Solwaraspora sp. WMMA2056]